MIIAHSRKFVFVKAMKVAGSSVELALYPSLSDGDVIAPIGGGGLKRLGSSLPTNLRIRKLSHADAITLMRLYPETVKHDYTYFCVARNPWHRALSLFTWINRTSILEMDEQRGVEAFRSFIRKPLPMMSLGSPIWRGEIICDLVIKYEGLAEGVSQLGVTLGLPEPLDVTSIRDKEGLRPAWSKDLDTMYDDETWARVSRLCAYEIAYFGYSYSQSAGTTSPLESFDNRKRIALLKDRDIEDRFAESVEEDYA
ncbi:hypothetical protein ACW9UR_14055 [Halovulum sp. GXIMD14794]